MTSNRDVFDAACWLGIFLVVALASSTTVASCGDYATGGTQVRYTLPS